MGPLPRCLHPSLGIPPVLVLVLVLEEQGEGQGRGKGGGGRGLSGRDALNSVSLAAALL